MNNFPHYGGYPHGYVHPEAYANPNEGMYGQQQTQAMHFSHNPNASFNFYIGAGTSQPIAPQGYLPDYRMNQAIMGLNGSADRSWMTGGGGGGRHNAYQMPSSSPSFGVQHQGRDAPHHIHSHLHHTSAGSGPRTEQHVFVIRHPDQQGDQSFIERSAGGCAHRHPHPHPHQPCNHHSQPQSSQEQQQQRQSFGAGLHPGGSSSQPMSFGASNRHQHQFIPTSFGSSMPNIVIQTMNSDANLSTSSFDSEPSGCPHPHQSASASPPHSQDQGLHFEEDLNQLSQSSIRSNRF